MSEPSANLAELRGANLLSALDEQLARTLLQLSSERDERVLLAAALVSRQVAQGHVCLPLPELVRGELSLGEELSALVPSWPSLEDWLDVLRLSPLCGSAPGESTPLVLDQGGRLYLRRHFERERALAKQIAQRVSQPLTLDAQFELEARLRHYFGDDPENRQRWAAERALTRAFCVVSGGPGTGKTSTVVKIVALAVEAALARGDVPPRVALMAPTGKAAVRLESAVRSAKLQLDCDPAVRDAIPEAATTIHRALQARARENRRASHEPLQLRLDWLFVDEASMVDLELMSDLFAALPDRARVVLLGDQYQLASVEAGAVLGDICGAGQTPAALKRVRLRRDTQSAPEALEPARSDSELRRSVVQLTHSYRYAAASGIDRLARAIQAGDASAALSVLADPAYPDVALVAPAARGLSSELANAIVAGYRPYLELCDQPERALPLFERFRVLSAHRRGELGVDALNRAIVRLLFERELIERADGNFLGRPILITQNDYRNRLWNGDLGLVSAPAPGRRAVCFVAPDGHTRELGFGRLPAHETAFALSVHKSQGSEVDEVCLVLPHEASRVVTRELLYTAVTRARVRVAIHASPALLEWAIAQHVARSTGLRDLLY